MGSPLRVFADEMSVILPRVHKEFLRFQSNAITTTEVTFAQMAVLHLLLEKKTCKMSELAKIFSVSTSAITGIVDRMVKSGLVKRIRGTEDRRIVNIRLTRKGKVIIQNVFAQQQKMIIAVFKHFTPDEREQYLHFVKKIHATLTKNKR